MLPMASPNPKSYQTSKTFKHLLAFAIPHDDAQQVSLKRSRLVSPKLDRMFINQENSSESPRTGIPNNANARPGTDEAVQRPSPVQV